MPRAAIILIVVALFVLAAAGYMLFGRASTESGVTASNAPATAAETTFINLTAQIDPVEFDTSILQDPRFTILQDIKTAIVAEPSGRVDPFAPLNNR